VSDLLGKSKRVQESHGLYRKWMNTGIVKMSMMKMEGFNVHENEGTCKVRWNKLSRR
jgi:hypothetical protein